MRSLFDRIGGTKAIETVVDDFYGRLVGDPRVLHHFHEERLPSLKTAQVHYLSYVLGADVAPPTTDLGAAHRNLDITDDQVRAVIDHLDEALDAAGVDDELRRQVMGLVGRLWYARLF
jgi:hemoglobin